MPMSYCVRAISLLLALIFCLSLANVAEAGLKKKGKALAVGGLAAAGVKSKDKKKDKVCPPPAEWPREFTNDGSGRFKALGVVIASEQRQEKPSGCSAIHVEGGGREEILITAEIELIQGSKINVWVGEQQYAAKYWEEGSCLELTVREGGKNDDRYLTRYATGNDCFDAVYSNSDPYKTYFEPKGYYYGLEAPVPHNDSQWAEDASQMWTLLTAEQPSLATMLVAYEVIMTGQDLNGDIPALSNNDFKQVCDKVFDKEYKALGKRMESEIGFEKCAPNQENVRRLMEWYHPEYKDFTATENWFNFADWSQPVFSVWGNGLDRRVKQQYKLRVDIMKAIRLANMVIAARLEPSVPTYLPAYLSGQFTEHQDKMMRTTEELFSVQSKSDVLNKIRQYELTPSILRSYQELLDDPEDYDEIFSFYIENMDFAKPSSEELYRKLYDRMAMVEACYEAKRGEVFVYIKSTQRDAARRGFNDAVKELSPQPKKDYVQAINAQYDAEYQKIIGPLRTADYNNEMREWCVDSANYLSNPALRAMYQQAGL